MLFRRMAFLKFASLVALSLSLVLAACGGSGSVRLSTQGDANAEGRLQSSDVENPKGGPPSWTLGEMRLSPDACQGVNLKPDYDELGVEHLMAFLKAQSIDFTLVRARSDLTYLDLTMPGGPVRLRVATLDSPRAAGRDLHEAILQHGPGSWGVHRSNLAVLAPIGDLEEVVAFATKTKLACWGVLTVAGRDDSFVVPGGYTEL